MTWWSILRHVWATNHTLGMQSEATLDNGVYGGRPFMEVGLYFFVVDDGVAMFLQTISLW